MRIIIRLFLLGFISVLLTRANGQVSTGYTWSQDFQDYVPLVAQAGTTPADIFPDTWDDMTYMGYTLPFAFYFNGTTYPAGTVIGLDTDGWITFNPTSMVGTFSGGSWISGVNSSGMYLYGTANNNGFAAFNMDVHHREYTIVTGNITTGSATVTGLSGTEFDSLRVGTRLIATGIPNGTVITSVNVGGGTITMSANATATTSGLTITPACSIFGMVRGTAPNREFVIQWTQVRKYAFPDHDNINFQLVLTEDGGVANDQKLKVIYGDVTTNSTLNVRVQVGLRGNSSADFNARTTATSWTETTAAITNNQGDTFKTTLKPPARLTYIWAPACVTLATTGSISGATNACPNSTQTYSVPAVPGANSYTWTYSGSGATYSATTVTPTNILNFNGSATGGVLSVTPSNACGPGSTSNLNISIPAAAVANISYPGSQVYCKSDPVKNVILVGPSGGTYSSTPAGLGLNTSNGQVTPGTSVEGIYSVIYNYTSSGCPGSDTTTVTIKEVVYANALALPVSVCNAANVQLNSAANSDYDIIPITYNVQSPSGSPTVLWNTLTDEAISGAITLPFSFAFYEQIYTQIYISSNGYIQFGSVTANSFTPQFVPDASAPNNILALTWANLVVDPSTNPGSYVRYFVNGVAPNRRFIVEYNNLRFAGGNSFQSVTGQIRLYENNNHIEIHAGIIDDNALNVVKTLGMENSLGIVGHSPLGYNAGPWNILTSKAWSFDPSGVSYLWSPSANLSSTTIPNPTVSGLASTTNYTVQITDNSTGCVGTATVPVNVLTAQMLSTTNSAKCGPGTISLTGTPASGNTIAWYDASSGGNVVGLGNSLTTPFIPTTTTFYAVAESMINAKATVGNGALIGSGYESIFHHDLGGVQMQFLIRASELTAAGLRTGNISTIGFKIPVLNSQSYSNFSISFLATSNTDMSAGLNNGAFVSSYSNASYTPVAGINNFNLAPGFIWNGSSNIIVKICWSNNNTGGTGNYAVVDATPYISGAYYTANSAASATICGSTSASGKLSFRPQFIFGGTVSACRSASMAAIATINPEPENLTIVPQTSIICGPLVQQLKYIGGKYVTGNKVTILQETFETFPSPQFSASGGMISASSSTTYFNQGSRAVRLAYTGTPSTSLTSGNNAYTMTSNFNMSSYGRAELKFSHICALENGDNTFDAGYVQYSSDAGATWITFSASDYTGPGALITSVNSLPVSGAIFSAKSYPDWAAQFTAATSTPGLAGPSASLWKTETINIPFTALTNQFRLRFVITNDVSISYYGWLIDNIQITGYNATLASVVWTPNGAGSGLFTDAAATIVYSGAAAAIVYAKPSVTTSYYATATGPTGCFMKDTTDVTVKPYNTWLGITSDWNDPDNWCPGAPTTTTDVVIPNGVPFYPLIFDSLPVARNIVIQNAASIEIQGAARLSVYGNLQNSGNIINNGTLTLSGSIAQTYPGNAGTISAMRILEIANTGAGVVLDKSSYVSEELKPTSGNFALSNFDFTIRSSDTLTARVSKLGATSAFTYGTGRFIVERYIKQGRKWRFLSIPTNTTQTINEAWQEAAVTAASNPVPGYGTHISSSVTPLPQYYDSYSPGGPSIKIWNAGIQNYSNLATTTTPIATDKGYMTFVRGNRLSLPSNSLLTATRLRTKGQLFTGNKTISQTGLLAAQFMSAGNPYASAIDMRQISRSNVSAMYYVWDPMLASSPYGGIFGLGAFQLFTLNTATGNYEVFPGGGSYGAPNSVDNKIESGSAFFVKASANGTASLTFTENSKTDGSRSVFRTYNNFQRMMVMLEKPDASPQNYFVADGVMLHFGRQYSNQVDADDANKLANTGEQVSITKANAELMLERHAPVTVNDTIFLRIKNMRAQSYRFMFSVENMAGTQAILVDRFLNTYTRMGSAGASYYEFSVNSTVGSSAADRFIIIFKQSVVIPPIFTEVNAQQKETNSIAVNWKVENENDIAEYIVERSFNGIIYSAGERMVDVLNNNSTSSYQLDDRAELKEKLFYRIKAIEKNGRSFYSDVVKLEAPRQISSLTISPNPVVNRKLNILFEGKPSGNYSVKILAATGQEVYSGFANVSSKHYVQQVLLPPSITPGIYSVQILLPGLFNETHKIIVAN